MAFISSLINRLGSYLWSFVHSPSEYEPPVPEIEVISPLMEKIKKRKGKKQAKKRAKKPIPQPPPLPQPTPGPIDIGPVPPLAPNEISYEAGPSEVVPTITSEERFQQKKELIQQLNTQLYQKLSALTLDAHHLELPGGYIRTTYKTVIEVPNMIESIQAQHGNGDEYTLEYPISVVTLPTLWYTLIQIGEQFPQLFNSRTTEVRYEYSTFHYNNNGTIQDISNDFATMIFTLENAQDRLALLNYFSDDLYQGRFVSNISITVRPKTVEDRNRGSFLRYYLPYQYAESIPQHIHDRYQISRQVAPQHQTWLKEIPLNQNHLVSNYFYLRSREQQEAIDPTTVTFQSYSEMCLLHAMRVQAEERGYRKPVFRKCYSSSDNVPKNNLIKIAEDLDVYIDLKYLHDKHDGSKTQVITQYYPKKNKRDLPKDTYELCLHEKHYFIYDKPMPMPVFGSINYPAIPKPSMSSLRFIEHLINSNILIPMTYQMHYSLRGKTKLDVPLVDDPENYCRPDLDLDHTKYDKQGNVVPTSITEDEDNGPYALTNGVPPYISYADTETMTDLARHEPIAACAIIERPTAYEPAQKMNQKEHREYISNDPRDNHHYYKFTGLGCVKKLIHTYRKLPRIAYREGEEDKRGLAVIVYCHNLMYDISFFTKHIGVEQWLGSGSTCKGAVSMIRHGDDILLDLNKDTATSIRIVFKDSMAFINDKLANFPKVFGFENDERLNHKFTFPHSFFTRQNGFDPNSAQNYTVSFEAIASHLPQVPPEQIAKDIEAANAFSLDKQVYPWKYLTYYCMLDVEILRKGFNIFRDSVLQLSPELSVDVHQLYTISALSEKVFKMTGAFRGVNAVTGPVRDFIMLCMKGGRTICRDNYAFHLKIKTEYMDCTSLYPTAIDRMGGMPLGNAKRIPEGWLLDSNYQTLKSQTCFFVKINILNIPKRLHFPHFSKENEQGSLQYSNDIRGIYYIDSVALESAERSHQMKAGVDYLIIGGYYYNEGIDPQMKFRSTIRFFFRKRLEVKKSNPTLALAYKLILNSIYGKTLQRDFTTRYKIARFHSNEEFEKYIDKRAFFIKEFVELENTTREVKVWNSILHITETKQEQYRVVRFHMDAPGYDHYNYAHCGTLILSVSKQIMYEVFDLAEELNIPIYYSDTDSALIDAQGMPKLAQTFLERYKRSMLGSDLGQFKSDFEPHPPPYYKPTSVPVSHEAYILGKKMHAHKCVYKAKLEHQAPQTEETTKLIQDQMRKQNDTSNLMYYDGKYYTDKEAELIYYHYKLKGVNPAAMDYTISQLANPLELYAKLYNGEIWDADLTVNNTKFSVKYNKDGLPSTKQNFHRRIKCNSDRKEITQPKI